MVSEGSAARELGAWGAGIPAEELSARTQADRRGRVQRQLDCDRSLGGDVAVEDLLFKSRARNPPLLTSDEGFQQRWASDFLGCGTPISYSSRTMRAAARHVETWRRRTALSDII